MLVQPFKTILSENKKVLIPIGIVLFILLVATYIFFAPQSRFSDVQNDLTAIRPSESHAYTDMEGNTVDLRTFKGKPLIVNSWASWIPFSQSELPLLTSVAKKYEGRVVILAINRMEDVHVIEAITNTFSIQDSLTILIDPTDHFYKAIDGYAMPETVFYDSNGIMIEHMRGVLTEEILIARIDSMLNK